MKLTTQCFYGNRKLLHIRTVIGVSSTQPRQYPVWFSDYSCIDHSKGTSTDLTSETNTVSFHFPGGIIWDLVCIWFALATCTSTVIVFCVVSVSWSVCGRVINLNNYCWDLRVKTVWFNIHAIYTKTYLGV